MIERKIINLERAVKVICADIPAKVNQHDNRYLTEGELWKELICCVLSSRVKYETAKKATQVLMAEKIIGLTYSYHPREREKKIRNILSNGFIINKTLTRYRFPNVRAKQITDIHSKIDELGSSLKKIVYCNVSPKEIRNLLINEFPGIGPKQASMFLRNAGVTYELAILDKHVMDYMSVVKLSGKSKNIKRNDYYKIENKLTKYASKLGYPVGFVDWAIWIVMRVATREGYI